MTPAEKDAITVVSKHTSHVRGARLPVAGSRLDELIDAELAKLGSRVTWHVERATDGWIASARWTNEGLIWQIHTQAAGDMDRAARWLLAALLEGGQQVLR